MAASWSLHAVPLHELANDGVLEWATSAGFSRGVPDRVPTSVALPSVVDVLAAFRTAGCHGTAWFKVRGEDSASRLAECPGSDTCLRSGGLDLGEVGVRVVGHVDSERPMPPDAAVESIAFRKPVGVAVLTALCALVLTAGPQLVFDVLTLDTRTRTWPRRLRLRRRHATASGGPFTTMGVQLAPPVRTSPSFRRQGSPAHVSLLSQPGAGPGIRPVGHEAAS